MGFKDFWNSVISSDSPASSKRLVTLIISIHFIVASFVILFIAFFVIFYTTKGKVDIALLGMLQDVLEYDFYIILSGLGFITAENVSQIIIEKAKAKFGVRDDDHHGGWGKKDHKEDRPDIEPAPPDEEQK